MEDNSPLPVVNGPSGMKKAPTLIASAVANLKNQNLKGNKKKKSQATAEVWSNPQKLESMQNAHP